MSARAQRNAIACTVPERADVRPGATVWSRRFWWAFVRGETILRTYGAYAGHLATAEALRVRRAARPHRCQDCGRAIARGDWHGSTFYAHYCLGCVTPIEPRPRFTATWPPAPAAVAERPDPAPA